VFGLHENADITYAQNEIKEMFDTILSLQARVASTAGKGRDEVLEEVATDILSKLPSTVSFIDLQKQYPVMYEESMNTVLQQEVN
jgi:dynein heavy chain